MMAHILDLPREIVILIFKYYLETDTQLNFLTCISNVCEEWSNICFDSQFWKKFDGSLSKKTLLRFCKEGRLRRTEEVIFSFSNDINLKPKNLSKIFAGLPNLKSINFSKVCNLNESALTSVGEYCCKLNGIKFADNKLTPDYKVTMKLMGNFIKLRGEFLNVIDLSYSKIVNMKQFLCEVAQACPNLEQLLLQDLREPAATNVFPIESVMKGCPKMKVLRLGMPITFSKLNIKDVVPGFPALEIFTHPARYEFSDKDLVNILSNSSNLKVLDIRGCEYISIDAVLSLPATHLEYIYLSMIRFYRTDRIIEIFQKWCRSLRIVDISKMKWISIDHILSDATSMGRMVNLECLNVSGTTISTATVIKIIENCENLHVLNLSSCRNIGRGRMREYRDKDEIEKLYKALTYC